MTRILITILALFCTGTMAFGQQNLTQKTDSLVLAKKEAYDIPGLAVGVVKNGEVIYAKGFGLRNINTGEKITENTIFHAASVSKLFTALAIMELVGEGKLNLEDKLTGILTNLRYTDERLDDVRLIDMLNHTSGMPDIFNYEWENNHESDNSLREYVEGKKLRLSTAPRTRYRYSNLAYDILGLVVTQAAGETFEDYVKRKILQPAGVETTDFRYFKIPEQLRSSPHTRNRITKKISVRDTYPYTREHAPSSTLNTSVKDMGLWMIHFMKQLQDSPNQALYQSMLEPTTTLNDNIGIGFQITTALGYKKAGHFGSDEGYRSYLFMIPEREMGFVILVNADYNDDIRHEVLHPIASMMLKAK